MFADFGFSSLKSDNNVRFFAVYRPDLNLWLKMQIHSVGLKYVDKDQSSSQ